MKKISFQTKKIKTIRFCIELLFLGVGLYFLNRVLSFEEVEFKEILSYWSEPTLFLSALLFSGIYFCLGWGIWLCVKKTDTVVSKKILPRHVMGALFISNLGKYIPGKIWAFLAFNSFGSRLGLSLSTLSSIFFINLFMGLLSALILFGLRFLPNSIATPCCLVIFISGVFYSDKVAGWVSSKIYFLKNRILPCCNILWTVQWVNAFLSGFAYMIIENHLGSEVPFSFTNIFSYHISYMVGFICLVFPAGIGIRESMLLYLGGVSKISAMSAAEARLITTGLDFILALLGILCLWRIGHRKVSSKK